MSGLGVFCKIVWFLNNSNQRWKKIPSKSSPIPWIWMAKLSAIGVFDVLYTVCFATRFWQCLLFIVFSFSLLFCRVFYEIWSSYVIGVLLNLCENACFLMIRTNIKPLQICADSVNSYFFMVAVNAKLHYKNIDSIFRLQCIYE